jgi:CHASE2 domain-containing sensor protein
VRAWRTTKLGIWLAIWRNRCLALLALHLVGWLALGRLVFVPGVPDETLPLDQWLRAGVFALVEPRDTLAVTYIDIDDALYRDRWHLPAVTPRDELARLIGALAAADSAAIVVDVDLAWGERDPELAAFLAAYSAPAPLVFVRHVDESEAGLALFQSAYDDVFEANARLDWAHAYFFTRNDGQIVDWAPWLVACANGTPQLLPSTAVLALEKVRGEAWAKPPLPSSCGTTAEQPTQRIVYTENFGFPRRANAAIGDVYNLDRGPARTVRAEALLDGSRIDASSLFKGRVVLIGGSHAAGQDLRSTPLGILPGAVVQANTIIHASPQLRADGGSAWVQRPLVAVMFAVLATLSLPLGAAIVATAAVLMIWLGSYYLTFEAVGLTVLLAIQYRFMTWLVEPFWKSHAEHGWRILLPKYLRGNKGT